MYFYFSPILGSNEIAHIPCVLATTASLHYKLA